MGEFSQKSKIQSLPLEIQIEIHGGLQKAIIRRLTKRGALLEVFIPDIKTQESVEFKLFLPSENTQVIEDSLVVKTYHKFKEIKKDGKLMVLKDQIIYYIEVHFKHPKLQSEVALENYLKRFEKKDMKPE